MRKLNLVLFIFELILFASLLTNTVSSDLYRSYISNPIVPEIKGELNSQGTAEVDLFTGAATYHYNFEVPPGTNGLKPSIALNYNSHNTKGTPTTLGTAWELTQSYIQRDTHYTPKNTSDDRFYLVLNGEKLELVYVASEGRFHTQIEQNLFIKKISGGNNQYGEHWVVKTKDGTTYRFGYTQESEQVSNLHNYVWRWHLDVVEDTHGNKIFYSYNENPYPQDSGATYLVGVEFNDDRSKKIQFIYENSDRADLRLVFDEGNKVRFSRRLKEVIVQVNSDVVRKYSIDYEKIDSLTFVSKITQFGNDGVSSLPPVEFSYKHPEKGWDTDSGWTVPWDAPFGVNINRMIQDSGVRLEDINGDGLVDMVRSLGDGSGGDYRKAWLNNRNKGWTESRDWEPPLWDSFLDDYPTGDDAGGRIVDVNGDAFPDIVKGAKCEFGCQHRTYLNTGARWTYDGTPPLYGDAVWELPYDVGFTDNHNRDTGVRLADVNQDGLVDVLRSGYCPSGDCGKQWINTRTGWVTDGTPPWYDDQVWKIPYGIGFIDRNYFDSGIRLVDVNGDHLVDIVVGHQCAQNPCDRVWLNTGSGWVTDGTPPFFSDQIWHSPYGLAFADGGSDTGVRFVDVNNDGLVDILQKFSCGSSACHRAWINNGHGWERDSEWEQFMFLVFVDNGETESVRLVDVNGDGLIDIVKNMCYPQSCYGPPEVMINRAANGYLLEEIKDNGGGRIQIEYAQSTAFDNTGDDNMSDLPFNIQVVKKITRDNGMNNEHHISITTEYAYESGMYDRDYDYQDFRGFGFVEEVLPDGTKVKHWFHQDKENYGREHKVETWNNVVYERIENDWDSHGQNGYFVTRLVGVKTSTFDTHNNPKVKVTEFEYDRYGNVIEKRELGELSVNSDDIRTEIDYVISEDKWIHVPKRVAFYDMSGLRKETKNLYDNGNYGNLPTQGDLTEVQHNIDGQSTAKWKYAYDSHGNVVEEQSPKNRIKTYAYGKVFPEKIINALGHVTLFSYDEKTGNLISETDANGILTFYEYDVFGRKIKEILPYDNSALPTVKFGYENDGVAPEAVTAKKKKEGAVTYDSITFYDGLKNVIQQRNNAANNVIVTDFFYDAHGRLEAQSNPYFGSGMNYATPQNVPKTIFEYDALNRLNGTIYPDGEKQRVEHDRWTRTIFDERGKKTEEILDAHGRTIEIKEHNGNEVYSTTYNYDGIGNVLRITNDKANSIQYEYDLLGRKIRIHDPDMGRLTYDYDDEELLSQTDNRNITISFAYDSDGRMTRKSSPHENTVYVYDTQLNGTLSEVRGAVNKNFTYDQRKRITQEKTIIDGQTFTTTTEYNAADQVTKRRFANGEEVIFSYDTAGRASAVSPALNSITYNAFSQPTKRTYPFIITDIDYDTRGRTLSITTGNYQQKRYTYDGAGNLLMLSDKGKITDYGYDDIERLVHATQQGAYDFRYDYDSIGNIRSITNGALSLVSQQSGQPVHSPTQISGDNNLLYRTNQAPVVQPLANITVVAGENVTVAINASDTDGDTLVYSVNSAKFASHTTVFTWQTTENDAGTYPLEFSVNDGTTTVILPITITIAPCQKHSFFSDNDKDGYGNLEQLSCKQPSGTVVNGNDCNDNDINVFPGALEQFNRKDDNCDGTVDEGFITLTGQVLRTLVERTGNLYYSNRCLFWACQRTRSLTLSCPSGYNVHEYSTKIKQMSSFRLTNTAAFSDRVTWTYDSSRTTSRMTIDVDAMLTCTSPLSLQTSSGRFELRGASSAALLQEIGSTVEVTGIQNGQFFDVVEYKVTNKCTPNCKYSTTCSKSVSDGCGGMCRRETEGIGCGNWMMCSNGACIPYSWWYNYYFYNIRRSRSWW